MQTNASGSKQSGRLIGLPSDLQLRAVSEENGNSVCFHFGKLIKLTVCITADKITPTKIWKRRLYVSLVYESLISLRVA